MNEQTIFIEALERTDPQDRAAFLDQACPGDPALRQRLERLLAQHQHAGDFLEAPAGAPSPTLDEPVTERPGTVFGPYKLIEPIGEGGMGSVWMAQQAEPVKRLVALKLIKAGMDSKQVIARFEAERQALALMDHPNIARVLDGGTTAQGRPYFVMDLVKGVPITRYCDEHHLTPRQRLELFVPVCQAIQHAHQKGIIHRDLKPSNVLVAPYDGRPVVKVIDFGVAKAAGQPLTDKTLVTGFGAVVGTLEYMSPEQAELNNHDIDTRSDIYSLGVLLYELLTGGPPFSRQDLERAGMLEMLRVIREQEPSKPSTKLSTAEGLPTLAANRGTEPAKLTKLVRGELDWIVMKALEKDRSRRYETANGFALDVQRYLNDEPVQACPPSAVYRLRKFARRNKGGLAVAALVLCFLALLGGAIGWAVRDRSAREAEAARQQAKRQGKVAGEVESIFAEVDRLEKEQKWPEALAAARRAEAALAGGEADAETTERVHQRVKDLEFIDRLEQVRIEDHNLPDNLDRGFAQAFRDYGVEVDELAVEASVERLRARPSLAVPLAAALDDWIFARRFNPKGDPVGWKRLVAIAHGIDPEPLRDRLRSTPSPSPPAAADHLRQLAESINVRDHHPATLYRLADAVAGDLRVRILREAHYTYPGDFWVTYALAGALRDQKDHEGAIRFYTAAMCLRPDRRHSVVFSLSSALRAQGKLDEAVALYRKALEPDPSQRGFISVAALYRELGDTLRDQKKLDEAIDAYRKAIEIQPKRVDHHYYLATALHSHGKLDEAIDAYRKALEISPNFGQASNNLGDALRAQNKLDEAIAIYRQSIEANPKNAGACYLIIGEIQREQKKLDEAIDAYRKAIETDQTPKLKNAALASFQLGSALSRQGKLDEAIDAYRKAIELDPEYYAAGAAINLGDILAGQNKLDEAIDAYRKAIETDQDYATIAAYVRLGGVLRKLGSVDKTDSLFREIERAITRKAVREKPEDDQARNALAHCLNGWAYVLATLLEPKLRDPGRALSLAQEAAELAPNNGVFWRTLGMAHYRMGNWTAARGALEKSIELGDQNSAALFFLAMAHGQLGEKDKARERYDKAVGWMEKNQPTNENLRRFRAEASALLGLPDPGKASALVEQARALRDQKKFTEAEAALREAIQLRPALPEAHSTLGWLLQSQGKPAEAEDAFRQVVRLAPDSAQGHAGLGRALLMQKKFADAEKALREALRLNPAHPRAQEWLDQALLGQGKPAEAERLDKKSGGKVEEPE